MSEHIDLLRWVTDALLEVCDGAQERDGAGFNKPDSLTVNTSYPDMVTIAPLLLKYKEQIEAAGFNFMALKEAVEAVAGPAPPHNWADHKLGFGKHADLTYAEMAENERDYLSWMVQEFKHDDPGWISANTVLCNTPISDNEIERQSEEELLKINIRITQDHKMIHIKSPYQAKELCRGLPGRIWISGGWVCPLHAIEEVYGTFQRVRDVYRVSYAPEFLTALEDSRSIADIAGVTESDFEIEHFGNGKEMMSFQKAALEFAEATGYNLMIADSMGLGKTVEALAALAAHPEMRPAVIVCPASLKLNWQREAEAWLETDERIEVIKSGKTYKLDADIVVINYDVLKKWLSELQHIEPQILIADESHAAKNPKSARSKALKELASTTPHKVLLTGTPVLNRPSELWNQLSIIDPTTYSSNRFFKWHLQYTAAHKIKIGREPDPTRAGKWRDKTAWNFSGASNLEELAQSLKSIMIRRTKEQVLPELPAKRRSTVLLDIDNRKEYDRANDEFVAWITEQNELKAHTADMVDWNKPLSPGSDAALTDGAIAEKASNAEQLVKIEYLRQIAIQGKMKQALSWIETFLESGEKLVVFATHKATVHALEREYGTVAVKIDGSVSSEKRQEAVDRFQNDPETRLFIGNIKAAGVGITLTAASNVAFLELDWTPALLEQAEDRCHRIGQENAVNIYYLLANNTVDQSIAAMLEEKRNVIDQITGDENTPGFDLFDLVSGGD